MKTIIVIIVSLLFATFNGFSQSIQSIDETNQLRPVFYFDPEELGVDHVDLGHCQEVFSLHTLVGGQKAKCPIIADYKSVIKNGKRVISMQPSYDLNPKMTYQLSFGEGNLTYNVNAKDLPIEEGSVEQVYPVSEEIPANLLTLYIHFDTPMKPDRKAFHSVALVREDGSEVSDVWRHRAVWSQDNKVLALMIHPGRIKKGIVSTDALAEVFPVGEKISVVLKSGLETKHGYSIDEKTIKTYSIRTDVRQKVSKKVKIAEKPKVNSDEALNLSFKSQMDYGLVKKWVRIEHEGEFLQGSFLSENDKEWSFKPANIWASGSYQIRINQKIGDPGHNNMNRLFEEKTVKNFEQEQKQNKELILKFTLN